MLGSHAGEKTIGANNNTFLGFKAGVDITTGNQNVAVGLMPLINKLKQVLMWQWVLIHNFIVALMLLEIILLLVMKAS
ncbi:MAG: hypothetical protein CM15mL4_0510 [uncultured marine virus]|nr:MAG: hypothetical protein CM15mL4_0510 [uncultured marine virus]